ncbi:MAG: ferredoxin [Candidatus Wolfebacteria bacterium]|nr:ferredoxin [Candidatus Wolfebacteria bacterium]
MKEKIKITYDRNKCTNCGNCAAICPVFFESKDNQTSLKNSQEVDGKHWLEAEVNDEELALLKQAAKFCPVRIINIEKN